MKAKAFEAIGLAAVIFVSALILQQPGGSDWELCFRPAVTELVTLHNPHNIPGYYSPTFTLLPLIPLAALPLRIALAMLSALAVGVYYYAARHLGASVFVAGAMVSNPMWLIHHLYNPNLDWLIAIGYILPVSLPGALLLLTKPQLGAGVLIYDALQKPKVALAALGALALTVVFYGPYMLGWAKPITGGHNLSFWPWSLPVGVILLMVSLWKKERGLSLVAVPLMSPYMGYYSWPIILLGLIPKYNRLAVVISIVVTVIIIGWGVIA